MSTEEERDLATDLTVKYIAENYAPVGSVNCKDYVTSADIARELSEMVIVKIDKITDLMDKAGFKTEFILGKPHWVVFIK